jgi:hypothetical protein
LPVCYVYVPDVSTNISILILVSFEDAVVQGIRTIAIDPNIMVQIKEACFHQLSKFSSKEECEEAAEKILDKYSGPVLRAMLRR